MTTNQEVSSQVVSTSRPGLLVRLIPGLTLGPKIAVENPQGEFLGYFSFPELKEYAWNPTECERIWKESQRVSDPTLRKLFEAIYEVYRIAFTGIPPKPLDGISLLDFPPYRGALEKLSSLLGFKLEGNESLYEIVARMRQKESVTLVNS